VSPLAIGHNLTEQSTHQKTMLIKAVYTAFLAIFYCAFVSQKTKWTNL